MFSNAEILASVVSKWIMPYASVIVSNHIDKIPFLNSIQSKISSTGWVSSSWKLSNELLPFAEPVIKAMVAPTLNKVFSNIPDEQIPVLAHSIVDEALKKGSIILLDGNIKFDNTDLNPLKKLLNANLPITEQVLTYQIKEDEQC